MDAPSPDDQHRVAFLTGVSSGIGKALAGSLLDRGWRVRGVSRRPPEIAAPRFAHATLDVTDHARTAAVLEPLLPEGPVDLAILNAGVLGPLGDLRDCSLDAMRRTFEVNLWANKTLTDFLLARPGGVRQVVMISSGASVSGNRGWSSYGLSKAALNMLVKLYAAEAEGTHFAAFAPGVVDSAMQAEIYDRPADARHPSFDRLRERRFTAAMPGPDEAAPRLLEAMLVLPERYASGEFVDVRTM